MRRRESPRFACRFLCAAAFGILSAPAARASDSTTQCLRAYEAGQRLRQSGDLVTAAGELRMCGGPGCPARMQGDCQRWLDDVERSTPTVTFRVRDASGERLTNVTISIDGSAPRSLDGRALLMNPGEHWVVFEHPGHQRLATSVFVTEGEKLEPRDVTLQTLVRRDAVLPPGLLGLPRAESDPALSPWPLALAALGVVGGSSFVYFGVRATSGEAELGGCSPDCSQERVDAVKRHYLWSNVSLGVGLVGLIGAGLCLLLDEPSASAATPRHGVQLGRTASWVMRF